MLRAHSPMAWLALLALGACSASTAPTPSADLEEAADALITFPAAAYANALQVSYGARTRSAFMPSDEFVALKFSGRKGDTIRFGATSQTGASAVSYLVFRSRNVGAVRVAGDPPGTYRHTLASDGEYFVMMRSRDRAAATLTSTLERMSAPSPTLPVVSAAPFVAGTYAGGVPQRTTVSELVVKGLPWRECFAATGCKALDPAHVARVNVEARHDVLVPPGQVLVAARVETQGDMLWEDFDGMAGVRAATTDLAINVGKPVDYITPVAPKFPVSLSLDAATVNTPMRSRLSIGGTKWASPDGSRWIEFMPVEAVADWVLPRPQPRPQNLEPQADELGFSIPTFDRTPLPDEEVLSRFQPGAEQMDVYTFPFAGPYYGALGGAFRARRNCGPRTGCESWQLFEQQRSSNNPSDALVKMFGPNPIWSLTDMTLRVSGVDSYIIDLSFNGMHAISTPVENGRATFFNARTGQTQQAVVTARGLFLVENERPREVSRRRVDLPAAKFELTTTTEAGYFREELDVSSPGAYLFLPFGHEW